MTFRTALRINRKELAFVYASYLAMALACYFYAGDLMKRRIDILSRAEMRDYESTLRSLILAHETALDYAASAVVKALDRKDDGPEELRELLKSLNDMFKRQKGLRNVFVSVYGYLNGDYLDGADWIPGKFYNPKTAPWLRGALIANGTFHSKPYIDARTGHAVSSISRVVFDSRGESRGVLAVDYLLNPIAEMVANYQLAGSGHGLLLDDSFKILTSPDKGRIGLTIDRLPGYGGLREIMESRGDGQGAELLTLDGERDIVFFSRLENGWYLVLIAPYKYYYGQAFRLMPVVVGLALVLASGLSFILMRLNAAKRRSEEANRSKSSFLARMSHEIRTPLNAIIGLGEMTLRDYGRPEGSRRLAEIMTASRNLLLLVNGILDLAKVESGRLELRPAPYKTAGLLNDVIALIRPSLGELDLSVSADPELPAEMTGDETLVRQIIMNLLSNAVKYTPRGFVRLSLTGGPAGPGQVRLRIMVEDSGIGLKPEQTAIIFDEFVRVEEKSRPIEGTGLGLTIVHRLCQAMGGEIGVKSEYGRGSSFWALIPQGASGPPLGEFKPAAPDLPVLAAAPPFLIPGLRALVVDDVAVNLEVADGLLSLYKIRASLALDWRAALKAAAKETFDLVFIDHMMPDMDGLETLKALRQMDGLKGVPMIALTANAMSGMREMFLKHGFDDYLAKPVELEALNEILARWTPPYRRIPAPPGKTAAAPPPEETSGARAFEPRAGGLGEEKYRAVLRIFLRDLKARRPLLKPGAPELALQLHSLKSALGGIGAHELSGRAAALESAAPPEALEAFGAALDDLSAAISDYLAREPAGREPAAGAWPASDLLDLKAALADQDIGRIDLALERLAQSAAAPAILEELSERILLADFGAALEMVEHLSREAGDAS